MSSLPYRWEARRCGLYRRTYVAPLACLNGEGSS
jgi:hypothetical protein